MIFIKLLDHSIKLPVSFFQSLYFLCGIVLLILSHTLFGISQKFFPLPLGNTDQFFDCIQYNSV